jgi:uncharacterized membrane protein
MSINKTDDAVSEYLHEVEARLGDLPLLQRRELLADLEAHIANERAERHVRSEGEVLEILERLGSPDVVAAAAYEEAGAPGPARNTVTTFVHRRSSPTWVRILAVVAAALLVLLILAIGVAVVTAGATSERIEPTPVRPAPAAPR